MAEDKDIAKPEHIGMDNLPKDVRDRADLNHEIMGEGFSRVKRYLTDDDPERLGEDKEKKAERKHLNRLQQLLLDETYRAAYEAAIRNLYETQNEVYEALSKAVDDLQASKAAHQDILDRASTLPDGTRVFLDEDGSAYTEDGRKLTDKELGQVEWKEDSPSWSTFKKSHEQLLKDQERVDLLQRHTHRLEEIEQELKDSDNPPSKDRIEELEQELQDIRHDATATVAPQDTYEVTKVAPTSVPDWNF